MKRKLIVEEIVNKIKNISNLADWDKSQIDFLAFFVGVIKLQKMFEYIGVKINDFKITYEEKFGICFSKKLIEQKILNGETIVPDNIKDLVRLFFKNKLSKVQYDKFFEDREFFVNPMGETLYIKNNFQKSILEYYNKKNDKFFDQNDVKILSNDLSVSETKISYNVKKLGLPIRTNIETKIINALKIYNDKIKYFNDNNFIKFEKNYWINQNAEIWKYINNKFKKVKILERMNNKGILYYSASINGKQIYIHKLLATIYINNFNKYKWVRAIDGNFRNLNTNNFEWVKYPAMTRVIKNINNVKPSWLNFVIDNFISGININILCKIISNKARRINLFPNNHNIETTIEKIIRDYSKNKNKIFPIFEINSQLGNAVFINKTILNKFRKVEND